MTNSKPNFELLTRADITQVYSGKNNRCCCGCAGKHTKSDEKGFGFMAKKITKLILAAPAEVELEDEYAAIVIGERLYIAYLQPGVRARIESSPTQA